MAFACPVPGCNHVADNVDALAGHISGLQATDDSHADYGEIRRFELFECEIEQQGANR